MKYFPLAPFLFVLMAILALLTLGSSRRHEQDRAYQDSSLKLIEAQKNEINAYEKDLQAQRDLVAAQRKEIARLEANQK